MADETISAELATREQAKREQTNPVPLSMTIQYDPKQAAPPPIAPGQEGFPGEGGPPPAPAEGATPEAAAPAPKEGAAPPAPAGPDPKLTANEAKTAFEALIKQFMKDVGVTQPLGEKGPLETAVGSPGQTVGDPKDLIRRVMRGLDLGLQVAMAPAVGAGTLAGKVVEQAAPLPYKAAAAVGVPVPESLTTAQETGASRAVKEFVQILGGMATGPGAMIGPAAKQGAKRAQESGRSLALKGEVRAAIGEERGAIGRVPIPPKPQRRVPTLRPATKEEAEMALTTDASTLQVGDKLMAIKWGEMADNEAIANTVKKLRALYTEKHTIPIEETQRLATALREAGFEESVLKRALVDGKTRAEAQALMDISKKGIERANELRETLREMIPGGADYQRTVQEFQVQLGISGRYIQLLDDLIGEAGGTLRIAQEAAQQIGGKRMEWMRDYADKVAKGLIRDVDKLPDLWDAMPRKEQKWQFTRLATKHAWDILRELAYDSMLFTFKGQMANIIGNSINLKRPVDLTLASGIGTLRHAILGGEPAIPLRQAAASGQGMLAALTEAHWVAWDTFLTGQSRFGDEFKSVQRAISGERVAETLAAKNISLADPISKAIDVTGFTAGIGNRALGAGDEWFKLVHYSARSFELAAEHAAKMGAKGPEIKLEMRQFLRNMPDEAKREAVAHAHHMTYTEPLSGTLKWMDSVADSPALVGFIPFFKTLANLMKGGFEHMPGLNFFVERSRKAILNGGTVGDLAWAKLAEGTALLTIGSWYYDNGILTGRRPENAALAKLHEEMGWLPDAVTFYNDEGEPTGYMSLNRLDPANQPFIFASHIKELLEDMGRDSISEATAGEIIVAAAVTLGEYTQDISMMRGVKDALETFSTSTLREAEARQKYFTRRAAQLAVPSGLGQITAANDPFVREASTFSDQVCSRLPWCASGLYPSRKLNGEPRLRTQAIGPKWLQFASPLPYNPARPDPVSITIASNNMRISYPSRVIMGRKPSEFEPPHPAKDGIRLTDAQWDLYQRLAGNEYKVPIQEMEGLIKALGYSGTFPAGGQYGMWDLLTVLTQTEFYKNRLTSGSPSGKEKLVLGVIAHYRDGAVKQLVLHEKDWLGAKYDPANDFQTKYFGKKLSHAEAMAGLEIRQQAEDALEKVPNLGPGTGPPRFPRSTDLPATLGR